MDELEILDPFEKMLAEERRAQEALSSRYKALQSSLERRINLPFDPTLMRVATALLSPTKSGSTGESIGMATEAVLDQSEKESLRQREVLKMQAELEERMLEMKRQGMGIQALQRLRPGQKPSTAPTEKAAPAGAVAGMPAGGIGVQIAPPDPGYMPEDQYAVMLYSSGMKPGEIMKELEKRRRDNIEVREGGVFNKAEGTFYATPKGDVVEKFPVRNPDTGKFEPYNVPTNVAARLSQLQLTDQSAYDQMVREQVFGQRPAAGAPAAPTAEPLGAPAVGAPPTMAAAGRRPTASESAASAAALETEAKETAKEGVTAFTKSQNAYQGAPTLFNTAETMNRLVFDNPRAFELLSKPGLANAIMRAADQGIQIGLVGSIKLPTAELSKYKLSQEDLDTLNVFANQMAIAKNANRQMTRVVGEGAMSDFETQLANQMLDVPNASPDAIRMINEYTMMRARHIEQKHELWAQLREQGMSATEALTSPQMRDLEQGYQGALRAVAQQNASILSSAASRRKQPKAANPSAITPEAIEAERKRRGLQ